MRRPILLALTGGLLAVPAAAQDAPAGRATYERWCAGCHGVEGRGDGPAAATMLPRPRDFTGALYEIRTTPSGALPTDGDILRMIDEGMPGTAMPGWKDQLSREQRDQLVEYLKSFSAFFESESAPEPVEIGGAPGASEEALAEGREFYERIECWKCHGQAGRGDGPSAPTLENEQGQPIRATDLTENWHFNGGGSAEEIFTRLMTGLNGAPMPSFADLIDADFMTEEQLWNVALYVRSLSPEKPPMAREVIRARRATEGLPAGVDDEAWAGVERFYVPLVGQVIVEPRWFAPRVDGVWVQAVHDGTEVVLRLTWHDPSESPDPAWADWRARMGTAMTPAAAPDPTPPPAAEPDTAAAAEPAMPAGAGAAPDALIVQFPTVVPQGMERPYFLLGSEADPVYLWRWESGGAGASEAIGRGLEGIEALAGAGALEAEAVYEEGEWRLMIRRDLAAGEVENRLEMVEGRPIPMALLAWDGDNGESGTQGAIGTWYFLVLEPPTSNSVYVIPLAAALLTAGLGVFVVARAQRRERDSST